MATNSSDKQPGIQSDLQLQSPRQIAIFASGTGSNAREIIRYFEGHAHISVALVLSNKASAGVLDIAAEAGIATHITSRKEFYQSEAVLELLKEKQVELIALAGFLWLVPEYLIGAFPGRILNIHPALLPAYGGKGMYGMNVHRAVHENGESRSGITIHAIDAEYDKGSLLLQESCDISDADSPEEIARRVLALEHRHFAPTIERVLIETPKAI